MAAFSVDSVFFPNPTIKNLSGFMEEAGNSFMVDTNYFSELHHPFYEQFPLQNPELDVRFHHINSQALDHSCDMVVVSDNNEPSSLTKKPSADSSSMAAKLENGEQVTQKLMISIDKKRKPKGARDGRSKIQKIKQSHEIKEEDKKKKPKAEKKDQKKVTDQEPPTGYIHVRARRGQATDSHSLAERVRREKISERMKILQHLVPGCDKITGKTLMLDEIINYVQSLQNQVEFLSTKLASVDHLFYDFGMDLDTLMVGPQIQELSSLASSQPLIQQFTPPTSFAHATTATTSTIPTTAAATATFATAADYPLVDTSAPLLLQGQRPSDFIQDTAGSLLWDVDEERQKFQNLSGFNKKLGSSFHQYSTP